MEVRATALSGLDDVAIEVLALLIDARHRYTISPSNFIVEIPAPPVEAAHARANVASEQRPEAVRQRRTVS
jgi:hypothetical protein